MINKTVKLNKKSIFVLFCIFILLKSNSNTISKIIYGATTTPLHQL
jgi:hypothetical protein